MKNWLTLITKIEKQCTCFAGDGWVLLREHFWWCVICRPMHDLLNNVMRHMLIGNVKNGLKERIITSWWNLRRSNTPAANQLVWIKGTKQVDIVDDLLPAANIGHTHSSTPSPCPSQRPLSSFGRCRSEVNTAFHMDFCDICKLCAACLALTVKKSSPFCI